MASVGGGRLIQGNYGIPGNPTNIELVVLEAGGPNGQQLVHYWRDDSISPNPPWNRSAVISTNATSSGSLIESTYGPSNLEVLVNESGNIAHYTRDNAGWHLVELFSSQATGAPSLIQGTYVDTPGSHPNFEAVILEGNNLCHYWRNNSAASPSWTKSVVISTDATSAGALIQSTITDIPGHPGNLEAVFLEGENLVHYTRKDSAPGIPWVFQTVVTTSAGIPSNAPGALIQSTFTSKPGAWGNFELIVLADSFEDGNRLEHWWRNNSDSNFTWSRSTVFGHAIECGSLIQTSYGDAGKPGNFFVVVHEGTRLLAFYRDNSADGLPWAQGFDIPLLADALG